MDEHKFDPKEVKAPVHLDGTPIDAADAADLHGKLMSGELKIVIPQEVKEQMEKAGLSMDDVRAALIASAKKALS